MLNLILLAVFFPFVAGAAIFVLGMMGIIAKTTLSIVFSLDMLKIAGWVCFTAGAFYVAANG